MAEGAHDEILHEVVHARNADPEHRTASLPFVHPPLGLGCLPPMPPLRLVMALDRQVLRLEKKPWIQAAVINRSFKGAARTVSGS